MWFSKAAGIRAGLLVLLVPLLVSCVHDQVSPGDELVSCSNLVIRKPANKGGVVLNDLVEGSVVTPVPRADVWVVIHPERDFKHPNAPGFWVQRPGEASGGRWISRVNFGDEDTPNGLRFEVQAFVAPTPPVQEGEVLPAFPRNAACKSNVVAVRFQPER